MNNIKRGNVCKRWGKHASECERKSTHAYRVRERRERESRTMLLDFKVDFSPKNV